MESNNTPSPNQDEAPTISHSSSENCYSEKTIKLLSRGLQELYKPSLNQTKGQLHELTTKQSVLIEQLHNENLQLSWMQNSNDLIRMFGIIKLYQNKLHGIKKDMRSLHEASTKLKKRAIRIQHQREKELYVKNQQLRQEQDLISKSSSSS